MAGNITNAPKNSYWPGRKRFAAVFNAVELAREGLSRPGREALRLLIYPHCQPVVWETMPEKVLITCSQNGTNDSSHESDTARYEVTSNLVQLIESRFELVDAVERAFRAPGGFSVLSGLPETGKTTVAVIQAWHAAMIGHKVLICGPTSRDVNAISNRLMDCMRRLDALMQRRGHTVSELKKVYLVTSLWEGNVTLDGLLAELKLARLRTTILDPSREESLINRIGPHSVFHELALRLEAERLFRSGVHNITQPLEDPRFKNIPFIYDKLEVYAKTRSLRSQKHLQAAISRILHRMLSEADIIVTSCLAASNIPQFQPTVVIVDQWDAKKDWECMIPLMKFDSTDFRSMIGNFDLPHWQRMYTYNQRVALPIRFATLMASKSPMNSVYTLSHLTSNNLVVKKRQEASEEHFSTRKNFGGFLRNTTESAHSPMYPTTKDVRDKAPQEDSKYNEQTANSWDVSDDTSGIASNTQRPIMDSAASDGMEVKVDQETSEYTEYYSKLWDDDIPRRHTIHDIKLRNPAGVADDEVEPPEEDFPRRHTIQVIELRESGGVVNNEVEPPEETDYVGYYFQSAEAADSPGSPPHTAVTQGTSEVDNDEAEPPEQTECVGHYSNPVYADNFSSSPLNAAVIQATEEVVNDEAEPPGQAEFAGYYSNPVYADIFSNSPLNAAVTQGTDEFKDDEAESFGPVEYEYTETTNGGSRLRMQWAASRRQAMVSTVVKSKWSDDRSDDSGMHRI